MRIDLTEKRRYRPEGSSTHVSGSLSRSLLCNVSILVSYICVVWGILDNNEVFLKKAKTLLLISSLRHRHRFVKLKCSETSFKAILLISTALLPPFPQKNGSTRTDLYSVSMRALVTARAGHLGAEIYGQ